MLFNIGHVIIFLILAANSILYVHYSLGGILVQGRIICKVYSLYYLDKILYAKLEGDLTFFLLFQICLPSLFKPYVSCNRKEINLMS